jgi:Tol biopolymer transport system component
MRSMVYSTLTLAAALVLGGCGDDTGTAPSGLPDSELARGGRKSLIAFAHKEADGTMQIYTVAPNGRQLTRITSGGYSNHSPRWTPDHSKIVFVSNRSGPETIFIMNADGSNQLQLTNSGCNDRNPAPSPDGTLIVFQRPCAGGGLFLVTTDGATLSQITDNSTDAEPSWSPDGARIIFASARINPLSDIWTVEVDGTNLTRLMPCDGTTCRAPVYSPDGTRFAAWVGDQGGSIGVYTGGGIAVARNLGSGTEYAPAWSPDGRKLIFVASRDGLDLYSVNVDGTGEAPFVLLPGDDVAPSWHR